ncbi:MAG TPA: phage integrase N-terminal SAM-like domain-containing protein [Nitrosomonas nitrosa]|nr:phage integrase N-terminal SAM-like domain-containing protein [Nitrosomonas nitrosa]
MLYDNENKLINKTNHATYAITSPAKKLLDQVREKIRYKHYSLSTAKTYISWIKHYIVFQGKRHPDDVGATEVERFLTYLAVLVLTFTLLAIFSI